MGLLCVKLVFLAVTFLVFLVGIGLVGVGIWIRADPSFHAVLALATEVSMESMFTVATVLVICIGVVLTFVSVFACCGAMYSSRCMIRAYIVILILLSIAQIIASIITGISRQTMSASLSPGIREALAPEVYYSTEGEPELFGKAMNVVQQQYHCCGIQNYTDYTEAGFNSSSTGWTLDSPVSCCELKEGASLETPGVEDIENITNCEQLLPTDFSSAGCEKSIAQEMNFHATIVLAVSSFALGLEVLSIVLGVCLWRAITKDDYY